MARAVANEKAKAEKTAELARQLKAKFPEVISEPAEFRVN